MNCAETRSLLSSYLDGAVNGRQMCEIGEHLASCASCEKYYAELKQTQNLVARLGRRQPSADLALRLRVAISQEAARRRRPFYEGALLGFQNTLRAAMVPATAGALSAAICFALLIGFFAMPQPVEARNNNDVPTMLYTPPQLVVSPFGWQASELNAESIVVDVSVDANGRVQDYRIISAPADAHDILPQLNNMLIFTQFNPATSFGQPVAGRAVLSFSRINVKG
jgi:Putative zinc-finger